MPAIGYAGQGRAGLCRAGSVAGQHTPPPPPPHLYHTAAHIAAATAATGPSLWPPLAATGGRGDDLRCLAQVLHSLLQSVSWWLGTREAQIHYR